MNFLTKNQFRALTIALWAAVAAVLIPIATANAARGLYVASYGNNSILINTLNASGGFDAGSPLASLSTGSGTSPVEIAMPANGRYAVVSNQNAAEGQYVVDRETGQLAANAAAAGAPLPAVDGQTYGLVMTPDGEHAYVVSLSGMKLYAYDVDPADGHLTANSTVNPAGYFPVQAVVTPDSKNLYLVTQGGVPSGTPGEVRQYTINANGSLTLKTGTGAPLPLTGDSQGQTAALTPDGKSLYVVSTGSASGHIQQYDIDPADGHLTAKTGLPAITIPAFPSDIVVSPDGESAYVADYNGERIAQYSISASGKLSDKAAPVDVSATPNRLAIRPDGKAIYVSTNVSSSSVQTLAINPDDGVLSPSSVTPGGSINTGMAIVPNQGPSAALDPVTGAVAGSPVTVDASDSDDFESFGSVARYDWDLGNGTTKTTTSPITTLTYPAAGTYTMTVRVTDDEGCSDALVTTGKIAYCNGSTQAVATRSVTVAPRPTAGTPVPPAQSGGGGVGATISKLKAKFKKKKITVSATLSSASSVKFTFAKKKGKKFKSAGSATKPGKTGANTITIKKKLKRGSYRLTATPAGGTPVTANFKVR